MVRNKSGYNTTVQDTLNESNLPLNDSVSNTDPRFGNTVVQPQAVPHPQNAI